MAPGVVFATLFIISDLNGPNKQALSYVGFLRLARDKRLNLFCRFVSLKENEVL
jgi:hypothetical protein